ncbi:hypothetical protein KEM55_002553 [Ascosphaera atra]|nr:hypothetical protein KEM55_002553 [Ascosphaera atra]
MPTVLLCPPIEQAQQPGVDTQPNPLPNVLQTPSGLAIIEMQGTLNLPARAMERIQEDIEAGGHAEATQFEIPIGRLVFPDYHGEDDGGNTSWMKKVYLYVGQNQRMTGEVKAIPKPLAVIRRRKAEDTQMELDKGDGVDDESEDELEIVDIIRHRIYFKLRPEPVSATTKET